MATNTLWKRSNPRFLAAMAAVSFLAMASASAEGGEPEVLPEEVVAPAAEWDDAQPWGGDPPQSWADDPKSVDCEEAPSWCEGNKTAVESR